jgi:hypothetical protein
MDGETAAALAMVDPQATDPRGGRGDGIGPLTGGNVRAQLDEGVATRVPLAVPRPAPPDGELELDHRLEPVDVGTVKQASLDQAHGPGRIARCQPPRLPP